MSEHRWLDLGNGRKVYRRVSAPRGPRSDLPMPHIRSDGMLDAVWNPVDGKYYDSMSAYERTVKEADAEIVGNDAGHWGQGPKEYEPEGVRGDIVQAWQKLTT